MKWESAKIKEVCLGIYDGPHATPQSVKMVQSS